jgi:hypothetical protein
LLISSELAGKDAIAGGGGQGGVDETSSFASTSAGMMMPATSAQSASASSASSASSGGGCASECQLPNATSACVNGVCAITQCNDHFGDCNSMASDGCELNLNNDADNCGSCKKACMKGKECKGAQCK